MHHHIVAVRGHEFRLHVPGSFAILNWGAAATANRGCCRWTHHIHVIFRRKRCIFRVCSGNLSARVVVSDAPRNAVPRFTRDVRTAVPGALPLLALLPLLTVSRALLPAAGSVAVSTTAGLRWQRRGWAERGKCNGESDD